MKSLQQEYGGGRVSVCTLLGSTSDDGTIFPEYGQCIPWARREGVDHKGKEEKEPLLWD